MEPELPTTWTPTSAHEEPQRFLEDYFEVMSDDSAEGQDRWNMIFEVAEGIVRNSPFTETLSLLQVGLELSDSGRATAYFAAGLLEDFVYYRVKSEAETAELETAMRQDPALMSAFTDGLVWGIEGLPDHLQNMLARYAPD